MTALQNWLKDNSVDSRSILAALRGLWRESAVDEPATAAEPQLMGRGLERC